MDKGIVAEWLLCQVMPPERATELVGDLLESNATAHRIGFWGPLALLMMRFSWRTILGLALSPVLSLLIMFFSFPIFTRLLGDSFEFAVASPTQLYLLGIAVLVWEATIISCVRFPLRSAWVTVAVTASLVSAIFVYCLPIPHHVAILTTATILLLVYSASNRDRFKALGALVCTVTISWLLAYTFAKLFPDPNSIFSWVSSALVLLLVPITENTSTTFFARKFTTAT